MVESNNKSTINEIMTEKAHDVINTIIKEGTSRERKIVDNVISFMGAAGGTGTSTLVANIAYEMSRRGLLVLVLDMNICYPVQYSFLGIEQSKRSLMGTEIIRSDLLSAVAGNNSIGESIQYRGRLGGKIGVMYANNRTLQDLVRCEGSKHCRSNVEAIISEMKRLFDVVLIDCPNSIDSVLINTAIYNSDYLYTVWDEGVSSIANIGKIRRNLAEVGVEDYKVRAIMNKKTDIYYPKSIFRELGIRLYGVLPYEKSIIESSLKGELFCKSGESSSEDTKLYIAGIKRLVDMLLDESGEIRKDVVENGLLHSNMNEVQKSDKAVTDGSVEKEVKSEDEVAGEVKEDNEKNEVEASEGEE